MNIFKYRYLALGCAGFLVSLYISYYLNTALKIILTAVFLALLTFAIIFCKIKKSEKCLDIVIKYAPLCLLLIISLTISMLVFDKDKGNAYLCDGAEHEIEATVSERVYISSYSEIYRVKIKSVDGAKRNINVLLTAESDTLGENNPSLIPNIGDTVLVKVIFRELEHSDMGFDELQSNLDSGITISAQCVEYYKTHENTRFSFIKFFRNVNEMLDNIFEENLSPEAYSLVRALILGNKDSLGYSVKRDFSRLGISHILAISGMHLTLIVTLLGFALSQLKASKRLKTVLIVVSVLFFTCLTGFSNSVLRSAAMFVLYSVPSLFGRRTDPITTLFVSVAAICAVTPYSVFSLSLTLSFLSMLACLCASKLVLNRRIFRKLKNPVLKYVITTTAISLCVMLVTLPVMFARFGYVSLISPLSNILLVPIFNFLVYLSPFVLVLSPVPFLSDFVGGVCNFTVKAILHITSVLSSLRGITLPLDGEIQLVGIILIALSVIAVLTIEKKKLKYAAVSLALGFVIFCTGCISLYVRRETTAEFTVYSDGTNDIVALQSGGGLVVTDITSGAWSNVANCSNLAVKLGYTEIEYYIVCDYSSKTAKSFDRLSDRLYIRNVVLPIPTEDEQKDYDKIVSIASKKKIGVSTISPSAEYCRADFEFYGGEMLVRSVKRPTCFSVLCKNVRFTYVASSAYELFDDFDERKLYTSDIAVFGAYGPKYKIQFSYEMPYADYILLLGDSCDFAGDKIKQKQFKTALPVTFTVE